MVDKDTQVILIYSCRYKSRLLYVTCENYETPGGVLLSRLDHNGTAQPCVLGRTISMTIQRQICLKQKSDLHFQNKWKN